MPLLHHFCELNSFPGGRLETMVSGRFHFVSVCQAKALALMARLDGVAVGQSAATEFVR